MDDIRLGKYRHFKGREYKVLGVARHSETLEELVVYRACIIQKNLGKMLCGQDLKKILFPVKRYIEKELSVLNI